MLEAKEIVCIVCPLGCKLRVVEDKSNESGFAVSGNKCSRGKEYGVKELSNPTRVLTTTVKIQNAHLNRIPVRTNGAIPKAKIFEAMEVINDIEVSAPISLGQVMVSNILDTGIDVIATRSMEEGEAKFA